MMRIGIDPGVKTGYAEVVEGNLSFLATGGFWSVYRRVCEIPVPEVEIIRIEVSTETHVWHRKKGEAHAAAIGQSVGACRREGELLAVEFERLGYPVETVDPQGTKGIDAKLFNRLTGWSGTSNNHTRDAAMLVVGEGNYRARI